MKAAIIGLGWQGKRHYQSLKELGVELACVIDVNPKGVLEKFLELAPDHVSDKPDVLERCKPDLVIIATNAKERLKIIKYCLKAGVKKIFCEKPLATSLADALEIKRLTEEAGCQFAVNHLRRWNSNYEKLLKVIDEGVIGDVRHLYAQVGSVGLGNEATHIVDKMRMCAKSDVEWVVGHIDRIGTPNPRGPQYNDPGGWGMMRFKNGVRAFIDTSEDTGLPSVMEVVGAYGKIIIEELHNHWKIFTRSKEDRAVALTKILTPLHSIPVFETLPWDVQLFTKCGLKEIISGSKVSCSADDGCKAIEAVMAFHVSDSEGGRKITLPLDKKYHNWEVNWA